MNSAARQLITALRLEPLPSEGGFFRSTWRSESASAIFYLMTAEQFSALHRLAQDEMWHFYAGDRVEHVQLDPREGAAIVSRLGPDVTTNELPQLLIPAGIWQGARIAPGSAQEGWALLGCTVSPPWDDRDFELGARDALLARYPAEAAWIHALTR
jgi:uncharacterized protein